MFQVIALCVTVLLAVAGFIINDQAARRAKRRDIRTQYLLSAYRSIESASNRPLDEAAARQIESALADIQLLGSPSQIAAAHAFADDFAADGGADTGPLLNELRAQLRSDLDLGPLPQRRTHLRITVSHTSANVEWLDVARISAEAIAAQQRAVGLPAIARNDTSTEGRGIEHVKEYELPAWMALQSALYAELEHHHIDPADLSLDQQLELAYERRVISEPIRKSIAGLEVLHELTIHDPDVTSAEDGRIGEFATLARAVTGLFDAGLAGPRD